VAWDIEYTDEFGLWWGSLNEDEQESIATAVKLLGEAGPQLAFPYSSGVNGSRHRHMRELRVQHKGRPYRILYAFDPHRVAILLLGGDKTGNDRWYQENIPMADKLYDQHLQILKKEGLYDG